MKVDVGTKRLKEHTLIPEVSGTTGWEDLSEKDWDENSSGGAGRKLSNSAFWREKINKFWRVKLDKEANHVQ